MYTPDCVPHIPCPIEAEAVCTFNGRVQTELLTAVMSGDFDIGANEMVSVDVLQRWTTSTRKAKARAVSLFLAHLRIVGTLSTFFPEAGDPPAFSLAHSRLQERALCSFALLRILAGQTIKGTLGYVSHVRTWYRTIYLAPFGDVGTQGSPSLTTQYATSLRTHFPVKDTETEARLPVTWSMVALFITEQLPSYRENWGICAAVAFAGLYRLGELCSTEHRPFDSAIDLCESDLQFLPSFWDADRVVINLGPSKADRFGDRARANQRLLPVDASNPTSPGLLLKKMIVLRYNLRPSQDPILRTVPLFQDQNGGHMKSRYVIAKMKRSLIAARFQPTDVLRITGHSLRIGGATRLFQLQASPEVLKRLGGWSSQAYRTYIRIQQDDLMQFSRRICT